MNIEVLEQRTLFAGAIESIDGVSSLELPPEFSIRAPVMLPMGFSGMEMMIPTSDLNFIAGEALVSAGEILNEYLFEPVSDVYDAGLEVAQVYYNNPSHLAGDVLYGAGKSLEFLGEVAESLGHLVDGAGEGLSDYSETVRHTGRTIMFGSVAYSYMCDPTLTTMYVGGTIGAAIWGASKIMPYAGTISSFAGSAVESLGSAMGSLGSLTANYGSDLAV